MSSIKSKTKSLARADDLPQRLEALLRGGNRASARARMSPELTYGRHAGPAPPTARLAAVALALFRREGYWHLPLTERPMTLAHHAGQISLPGGAVDDGETSLEAALRELEEELGFDAPHVVLGRMADCYVFASDFLVTPWLIASFEAETNWRPHDREVQTVVEMPIETLLDEQAVGRLTIERGPLVFHAPCYRMGSVRVWGATAMMLAELAQLLGDLLESDG
jgi:8-oxo-dGTP pyrophosphatase MutT (NUDIX family)